MTTIAAKVICDSVSEAGIRLTTMELTYPRVIHSELMTHRALSRNASSSRAIPLAKLIESVEKDPYVPLRWGVNGKGMQDHGEMSEFAKAQAERIYRNGLANAIKTAKEFLAMKEMPHKQIVNRILEPYSHITVVVTATEWANFFWLRDHKDADPVFQVLAARMYEAYCASTPYNTPEGGWHLPYIFEEDCERAMRYVLDHVLPEGDAFTEDWLTEQTKDVLFKMSAARCARVSYLNHDKTPPTIIDDLTTFGMLMSGTRMHASPVEHQAEPDTRVKRQVWFPVDDVLEPGDVEEVWKNPHTHGNFVGWKQFRKSFVGENIATNRT